MKNCFVNFYSSLKIINNISEIEKMGISDTALTNIFEIEFSIEGLIFYLKILLKIQAIIFF